MNLLCKSLPVLALGALAVFGCGGTANNNDDSLAADSTDTADQVSALSSLSSEGVDPSTGPTHAAAAQAAATAVTAKLSSGCVTTHVVGNQVTYTMNNCTGPYGLVSVTGALTATYTVQGTGTAATLTIVLSGTAIKINGASLNVNSTAVISGPTTNRTAVVNSNTTAVSARGNSITHAGNYTAGWDGVCLSMTGNFQTRAGLFNFMTQVDSYKRCLNHCPTQGTITFTGNAHTTTLTFNGTASASIMIDGRSGNLSLFCKP